MKRLLLLALLLASPTLAQVIDPTGAEAVFTPDRATTATLGALSAAITVPIMGRQGIGFQLVTANLNAIVTPEVSFDGGTTWLASSFVTIGGTSASTLTFSGGADTQQRSIVIVGGVSNVRVRVSTYTSGSGTAALRATDAPSTLLQVGSVTISGTVAVTQSTSPWVVSNSGTFAVQAAQSGTWTVQPGNTANTTAWLVTGTGGTFPVTGPLTDTQLRATPVPVSGTITTTPPANASTNVAQFGGTNVSTGTGTGGAGIPRVTVSSDSSLTANAGTNLNTSLLELDTTGAALNLAQASTTSGQTGPLAQGATTTAAPTYVTAKTNPLSLTTAGALRTDSSGTTQPVSGTVAATESGTWTVQPGNTANTTAWKVDGSAVTQPVSGTVTANIGTSGSLELDATGVALNLAQNSTTSGQTGPLVQGSVSTAAPTYTDAKTSPFSITTGGLLRTTATITSGGGVSSSFGSAFPATGAAAGFSDGTNMQGARVQDLDSGAGTEYGLGVNLRQIASGGSVEAGILAHPIRVDPTGTTAQLASQSGTWTVTQGPAAAVTAGWPVIGGALTATSGTWNNGTALNTAATITTTGYSSVIVGVIEAGGSFGGGVLTFEASDGTNFIPINGVCLTPGGTVCLTNTATSTYAAATFTGNALYQFNVAGTASFRVRISTALTGAGPTLVVNLQDVVGSANPYVAQLPDTLKAGAVKITTITAADSGLSGVAIGGTSATNTAISQNPVLIGIEAQSGLPTAATTGRQRQAVGSLDGAQFFRMGSPVPVLSVATGVAAVQTQVVAAPGASIVSYLSGITLTNTSATGGLVTVSYGTGAACATGNQPFLWVEFGASTAANATFNKDYLVPPTISANNSICIVGVALMSVNASMTTYRAP